LGIHWWGPFHSLAIVRSAKMPYSCKCLWVLKLRHALCAPVHYGGTYLYIHTHLGIRRGTPCASFFAMHRLMSRAALTTMWLCSKCRPLPLLSVSLIDGLPGCARTKFLIADVAVVHHEYHKRRFLDCLRRCVDRRLHLGAKWGWRAAWSGPDRTVHDISAQRCCCHGVRPTHIHEIGGCLCVQG
jgi:hypothetical protein